MQPKYTSFESRKERPTILIFVKSYLCHSFSSYEDIDNWYNLMVLAGKWPVRVYPELFPQELEI